MIENEIWKDVRGFEGKYCASNLGRVMSLKRKKVDEDQILEGTTRANGVRVVTLMRGRGNKQQIKRSILILSTFYQRRGGKWMIVHLDGDLSNCALDNLKWEKRSTIYKNKQGEEHPNSRLTDEEIYAIRADERSGRIIALDYGLSRVTVSRIKNRRIWGHI